MSFDGLDALVALCVLQPISILLLLPQVGSSWQNRTAFHKRSGPSEISKPQFSQVAQVLPVACE
jgi:hypothetical protein